MKVLLNDSPGGIMFVVVDLLLSRKTMSAQCSSFWCGCVSQSMQEWQSLEQVGRLSYVLPIHSQEVSASLG